MQIHGENRNQVFLLRAEDESIAFHKRQNHLCWASSALGKLTRQRGRWGEAGMMGTEKKGNKQGRRRGWMAFQLYSTWRIKKIPTSDVSDTVGKQKPMGLELTGAYLDPMGHRRTGYDDDYDKGLLLAGRTEGEREREREGKKDRKRTKRKSFKLKKTKTKKNDTKTQNKIKITSKQTLVSELWWWLTDSKGNKGSGKRCIQLLPSVSCNSFFFLYQRQYWKQSRAAIEKAKECRQAAGEIILSKMGLIKLLFFFFHFCCDIRIYE